MTVAILIVVLTVIVPTEEEILFRGYIFRALLNWRGPWLAAPTAGVAFAATHVGWIPVSLMVPAVLSCIGMCLLYR